MWETQFHLPHCQARGLHAHPGAGIKDLALRSAILGPNTPPPPCQAASLCLCWWFELSFFFFFGTLKFFFFFFLSVIMYFKYFNIIYPGFLCSWCGRRVASWVPSFYHLNQSSFYSFTIWLFRGKKSMLYIIVLPPTCSLKFDFLVKKKKSMLYIIILSPNV